MVIVFTMLKKTFILLSTIIIFLTIAIMGAVVVGFTSTAQIEINHLENQIKAFYLAEAGIAHAYWYLRTQAKIGKNFRSSKIILGDGSYAFSIDFLNSIITSTGYSGNITRTIQIEYKSF